MLNDTLSKIEQRLSQAENLKPENRAALEELLATLRSEIEAVSSESDEKADSIAGFTESSAREALRAKQDQDLLDLSLDGLRKSVRDFETSHPELTRVVNAICHQLSNLGI